MVTVSGISEVSTRVPSKEWPTECVAPAGALCDPMLVQLETITTRERTHERALYLKEIKVRTCKGAILEVRRGVKLHSCPPGEEKREEG